MTVGTPDTTKNNDTRENDASIKDNSSDVYSLSEDGEEGDRESGYEEELAEPRVDVDTLVQELNKIKVYAPRTPININEEFNPDDFPQSYKENSTKEKLVLGYAENFRRQYVHLYRDRKPLFLNPINECNTEKFVCTTIRPTELPYQELYDWDGAAEFVADYLNFTTLDPPFELPPRLLSPSTVLKEQKGNSFDYSILLCSLLVGAGYDAYVVSGYASRETCLMDETREICPLLKKKVESKVETRAKTAKKYTVRPPKDLRSKFELKMEKKRLDELAAEEERKIREEEERQAELEKPSPDDLHGLRVHAWVLVLEGKREVPESFFIEPFTGLSYPVNDERYCGIESVWNHQNYWVNMQDCSDGCKNLRYDLGDCTLWEFMFPSNEKPVLQMPEEDEFLEEEEDDDLKDVERHLDMPPSWIDPIRLSKKDFAMRCPQGKKIKYYKKAKLEKFAHYLMKDGLASKLSVYSDIELIDLIQTKEYYVHRKDKLCEKSHNNRTHWVVEYYAPGRVRCLKEHQYNATSPQPENERTMIFYHEARVDGLMRREETPTEMIEHFKDREDHLFYRQTNFGKRPKVFKPQENNGKATPRPIEKIVERYHRNKEVPANEDISELVFLMSEEKVQITYHTEDSKISASTREFLKPANSEDKGGQFTMTSDMHTTFQVDPLRRQKKQVDLYQMLVDLMVREEKCKEKIRESEEEVKDILDERTREEVASELEISVYDTLRNEKAKMHRRLLEKQQEEEKLRRQDMEIDYLAPFLSQLEDPDNITKSNAYKLRDDCLADLKQRLIDEANLIQARFEKETQELQKKQAWYQQNQVSMQKDDEEEYLNYCSEAMFRIHILELRLNRHKEMAPEKYMALEQKLKSDKRLSDYI